MKWTEEDTAILIAEFNKDPDNAVPTLMKLLDRSKASIIGKLVAEKLYAKEVTKGRKNKFSKAELVAQIAEKVDADEELLSGLIKASLPSLEYLLQRLNAEF